MTGHKNKGGRGHGLGNDPGGGPGGHRESSRRSGLANGGRNRFGNRGSALTRKDDTISEERTFAALPPVRGGAFARTWWGRAWLKALEDTALDDRQVKRGRRHARSGAVGAVSVRPGRITAVVQDRDGTAYRSDVLLQELSEEEWDRLVGLAAGSAGHIAALLDREMPPHLVEDAAAVGIELLPGIGDLEPECGCEAWDHCPHTTALCYQVARLLDEDPFVLMLMRGRGERALIEALQERSSGRPAKPPEDAEEVAAAAGRRRSGVSAEEAFAGRYFLPPLPAPPVPPAAPGEPPSLDTEAAPEPGLDPTALEFLAADAAARARMLLTGVVPLGEPPLTASQDAVRLAAGAPAPWIAARLAEGSGRERAALGLAVRAWRLGGPAALAVLEEEWQPAQEALRRAETRLAEAWEASERPALRPSGPARWTVVGTDTQLRLGPDGRWWPYREEHGVWVPAGPADQDPAAALAGPAATAET
ncbi:SWIM zinc finger family protein [Streptomyces roseicoloratus]|uniref:SWIM zinc finger family protein n=1 Tax=Streptomyces roseicoloratus TaxID=2508722 RepID=UPI0035A69C97